MANHKVPAYLVNLPKQEKQNSMEELSHMKKLDVYEKLVSYIEGKIDRLYQDEEKLNPSSDTQALWSISNYRGRRAQLKEILNLMK